MAIKLHRRYLCLHCQNVCFRRRRKKGCSCLGRPTYSARGCEAPVERGCASMAAARARRVSEICLLLRH